MGDSRKGNWVLKRKTRSKKLSEATKRMADWIKHHRRQEISILNKQLNRKLNGYYQYYGITFNYKGVKSYFEQVKRQLFKWLNRRGGKRKLNWPEFDEMITKRWPLNKPKICHSYIS